MLELKDIRLEMKADGRLLAAISDGMGSGEAAARESARCISLLRKFVCAGIERDAALAAVNSLLVMRDGEETFECSECGAKVPADANVCPQCGAKFDEDDE